MRDLPSSAELAELGRRLLLETVASLIPEERRREVHLVATAIAMLQREAAAGERPEREVRAMLEKLYAGSPGPADRLARLAADLRIGAFETSGSRERAARAILWRLTILKLREANPHFLAANGLA